MSGLELRLKDLFRTYSLCVGEKPNENQLIFYRLPLSRSSRSMF
ncbi:hypothetical protein [Globicatella sanguinis]